MDEITVKRVWQSATVMEANMLPTVLTQCEIQGWTVFSVMPGQSALGSATFIVLMHRPMPAEAA